MIPRTQLADIKSESAHCQHVDLNSELYNIATYVYALRNAFVAVGLYDVTLPKYVAGNSENVNSVKK